MKKSTQTKIIVALTVLNVLSIAVLGIMVLFEYLSR